MRCQGTASSLPQRLLHSPLVKRADYIPACNPSEERIRGSSIAIPRETETLLLTPQSLADTIPREFD